MIWMFRAAWIRVTWNTERRKVAVDEIQLFFADERERRVSLQMLKSAFHTLDSACISVLLSGSLSSSETAGDGDGLLAGALFPSFIFTRV